MTTEQQKKAARIGEIIGQAIGQASMCWKPTPTGVFDGTAASKILEETLEKVLAVEEENAGLREHLAKWMIANSFATGHGDTIDDLLKESAWQVKEIRDENSKLRERVLQVIRTNNNLVEECTRLTERVKELDRLKDYTWADTLPMPTAEELLARNRILRHENEQVYIATGKLEDEIDRLTADLAAVKPKFMGLSPPPCDKCGYNGPGYYQPESHSCVGEKS